MLSKSKPIFLVIGIIILFVSGYFYRGQALSFKFVDEEDNFTFGKYLKKGEKLYDDLITNHQPLTHIFSGDVQKLTNPSTIYLLLVRHREAVILWAIGWSLLLIYFFGLGALIFTLIFELTKIQILGNLFLAESLVVYPLLYMLGTILFVKQLSKFQSFLWGLSLGLSLFLLAPIWPALFALVILSFLKYKNNILTFLGFSLPGFLICLIYVLAHVSFLKYLYYTFFVNLTFTIPSYQNESLIFSFIKGLLSPLLAFTPQALTPTLIVIRIFALVFLISYIILFKLKKLKIFFLIILLLGLLNTRFVYPGTEGYNGFHILPWYASFIFLAPLLISNFLNEKKFLKFNLLGFVLISVAIIISFKLSITSLFSKTSPSLRDYHINYSTHEAFGEAVKIMSDPSDTLFVSTNAWLIYWQADTNHLPKLYGDYTWMVGFPPLKEKIIRAFEENPPTFFYCDNCRGIFLEKYLSKYGEVKQNNQSVRLYVLPQKLEKLTAEQIEKINYHNFTAN